MNEVVTEGLTLYYGCISSIYFYSSAGHIIPYEIVAIILDYVFEFHRADATERLRLFREDHGSLWQTIMSDVRMNCPKYSVFLTIDSAGPIFVSVFSYDCCIARLATMMPMAAIHRRALSLHREFLHPYNTSHPSIV